MNLMPRTHVLDALRRQNLGWRDVLGELIDNVFDAKANSIRISLSKDSITIKDAGVAQGKSILGPALK
jgi:hypothetical protein